MLLISADFFIIPEFLPPLSTSENSSLYFTWFVHFFAFPYTAVLQGLTEVISQKSRGII